MISLVKSTKDSKPLQLGSGFKLVTPDVEDMFADAALLQSGGDAHSAAAPSQAANVEKFILSSMCTLENLPAYRLDPPRGKAQYALLTITGKVDDVFVCECVQHLTESEAMDAKRSLLQVLQLAVRGNDKTTVKRDLEGVSLLEAKRCRTLGRCPTAEAIDPK